MIVGVIDVNKSNVSKDSFKKVNKSIGCGVCGNNSTNINTTTEKIVTRLAPNDDETAFEKINSGLITPFVMLLLLFSLLFGK